MKNFFPTQSRPGSLRTRLSKAPVEITPLSGAQLLPNQAQKDTSWPSRLLHMLLPVILLLGAANLQAQSCTLLDDDFSTNPVLSATQMPGAWYPDRYVPAAFVADAGRLKISISAADGAQLRPSSFSGGFYNTQGRKFDLCGKCVTVAKGDLYIPAAWATNFRRSDIWATAFNASDVISFYPIIGFRNVTGSNPQLSYWNGAAWVELGPPSAYDTWYTMEFRLNGSNLEYLINNSVVGTVPSNGSTYFGNIIMQAFNFNDSNLGASYDAGPNNSYDAFWDNLTTAGTGGNLVTNTNTGLKYCTIQSAVDAASTGDVIEVAAGTYAETVTINKSLEIRGANAGVSGCATRSTESVLQGSFVLSSDNIEIDGFEITGAGAQIRSSGANATWSDITIQNNYIHATTAGQPILHGFGSGGGIGADNWIVSNNKIEDIQAANATAIVLFNITNVTIANNCISHTNASFNGRRGINADGLQMASISGNTVDLGGDPSTNVSGNWLIQVSMSDRDVQDIVINGNTISNAYFGISTLSQRNVTNLTVTNNVIGPVSLGVTLNGGGAAPVISQPIQSNIIIANNNITTVTPTVSGGIGAAVRLRNLHETHANGPVSFSNVTANNNSFTVPSGDKAVINNYAPHTLNATCNWYGTADGATVATKISGSVTYVPFLSDGTDSAPATLGFQPAAGACIGGIPQLVAHVNSVTVTANNDGTTDTGTASVCNGVANSISITTAFQDLANLSTVSQPVRVYQTVNTTNVGGVAWCNNCQAALAAFTAGTSTTATLTNPAMPGSVVVTFQAWHDLDNNSSIDPGEPIGDIVQYTINVNPIPAISFTAQVPGGSPQNGNNNGPASVTLDFCAGQFFSYSNYMSVPGTKVGVLNDLDGSGNVTYNGAPVAVPRAQIDFGVDDTPGFFGGTYGPYGLSSGTSGNFVETFTPYYDSDNSGDYSDGDCLGTPVIITYNVSAPPAITCPANFEVLTSSNGLDDCNGVANWTHPTIPAVGACNLTSLTMSINGGTPEVVTPGGSASQTLNLGVHTVTYEATFSGSNTRTCSFDITVKDDELPKITCKPHTITFNGLDSMALTVADLVLSSSDNCGIDTTVLQYNKIGCLSVGTTVPVTVTITDVNGNVNTCTSDVTVDGLPCEWSSNSNSIGCTNNVTYTAGTGTWTNTASSCYYASPFTVDDVAFIQRTLCGDGKIEALVNSIGTPLGWAGVTMRETTAVGSKKAQLMTNLSNFSRREFRTATNGPAVPQQFPSQNRYWLRIVRAGNQFAMYVSPNGTAWYFIGAQNIVMNSCIEIGLVTTNYTANSNVTSVFSNVSFSGNNAPLGTGGSTEQRAESLEQPYSFEVYPNPTGGELNLDLTQYIGRSVRIETYSLEGKLLQFTELDEVQTTLERLDLKGFQNGMYLVKVKSAGLPEVARRVVKQ